MLPTAPAWSGRRPPLGTVKLTEIRSFSVENRSAPEPEINNLALADPPDNVVKQFNCDSALGRVVAAAFFAEHSWGRCVRDPVAFLNRASGGRV